MEIFMSTASAPVNIAVIKYWGKRNEDLILPVNDSLSVTLSKQFMCSTTTVACAPNFQSNKMWLNGKEQSLDNPRLKNCLREILLRVANDKAHIVKWPIHICSKNNFPTAAGLASSAAGYACLVYALGALYGVKDDLSIIARQGSGSACRSLYGGFVQWHKGKNNDGSDSLATQIATKAHWPELRVIILVVSAEKKETSSTFGMKRSLDTSDLMEHRTSVLVPQRIQRITKAILSKDFHTFAEITMKESNQFHAICLDTYPPIRYMNATSFKIIDFIHAYNTYYGTNKVAYTFDAGPNACLYLLDEDVPEVLNLIQQLFPSERNDYIRGLPVQPVKTSKNLLHDLKLEPVPDALQFIINTEVGDGPEILGEPVSHLLNDKGMPKE